MRRLGALIFLVSPLCGAIVWAAAGDESARTSIYSPVGKRDPFKPPTITAQPRELSAVNPLEKFSVEQMQLRAILRDTVGVRAMVEDPEGKTFILRVGDTVGRERATVSRILDNEIILTERTFNYLGRESLYEKILSLPPDKEIGQVDDGARSGASVTVPPAPSASQRSVPFATPPPPASAPPPAAEPKAPAETETIRGDPAGGLVY